MIANILISHVAIPSNIIGSWNIVFSKLVQKQPDFFSHIICPKTACNVDGIQYIHVELPFARYKIGLFIDDYSYTPFYTALKKILKKESFAVINIVDNIKALLTIDKLLRRDGIRNNVRIIYHLRGYTVELSDQQNFYSAINLLILQTQKSYNFQIAQHHAIVCGVKQIYNGVENQLFHPVSESARIQLRVDLGYSLDKYYFLWVSQDRPKKGLSVILQAWQSFCNGRPNIELLIIGANKKSEIPQVSFLGRIPNEQLPNFYQLSNFYIFSTLCHEGHPLSLTEALLCGTYCIASNIDPIGEILNFGEYGRLVEMPHDTKSWVRSLELSLEDYIINGNKFEIPSEKYSLNNWIRKVTDTIDEEKRYFEQYIDEPIS